MPKIAYEHDHRCLRMVVSYREKETRSIDIELLFLSLLMQAYKGDRPNEDALLADHQQRPKAPLHVPRKLAEFVLSLQRSLAAIAIYGFSSQ